MNRGSLKYPAREFSYFGNCIKGATFADRMLVVKNNIRIYAKTIS